MSPSFSGDPDRKFESVEASSAEHMFERRISVQRVGMIADDARDENAAGARRLAHIGDLYAVRSPEDDLEKRRWATAAPTTRRSR